jgi:hypothetical protein
VRHLPRSHLCALAHSRITHMPPSRQRLYIEVLTANVVVFMGNAMSCRLSLGSAVVVTSGGRRRSGSPMPEWGFYGAKLMGV